MAEVVYDLLEPGGALALIVHSTEGRQPPPNPGYPPIPHEELRALVKRYLGSNHRSGQDFVAPRDHTFEDVLVQTRFGLPTTVFASGVPDLVLDVESVISGYLSLSTSAPHLFGERLAAFTEDARAVLYDRSPSGRFWEWPGDTAIILGRRDTAPDAAR